MTVSSAKVTTAVFVQTIGLDTVGRASMPALPPARRSWIAEMDLPMTPELPVLALRSVPKGRQLVQADRLSTKFLLRHPEGVP